MSARATLNVSLTPQLLEMVAQRTKSGRYHSASEVVREALRLLDAHETATPSADDVRALIEGFGEGFYAVDHNWRIIYFNQTAAQHFGCQPEAALGRVFWELFPTAASTELGQLFLAAKENRQHVSSLTESAIFPGRWLTYRLFPFRTGMGVVFRDVTELRRAEAELRTSEQRYRTLIENANDLVMTLALDFTITSANAAVERLFGFKPEELIGTPLSRYVPEAQLALHKSMLERKLAGDPATTYEMTVIDKSGRPHVVETNSRLSFDTAGKPAEIHAIARDVSAQRAAEQSVRESEERIRLAAAAAGLGLFEIDWRTRRRFWSPEMRAILRVPPDVDIADDPSLIDGLVPEPHLSRYREKLANSTDPEGPGEIEDEHPIARFDRSEAWMHLRGKTYFDEFSGVRQASRTIGLVMDVTDRKRSEEANALLASVVRSSSDAIISIDTSRRIRSWNNGAERLYGYTAEEAIGAPLTIIAPEHLKDEALALAGQALAGEEVIFESVRRRKSGELVPVGISGSPMRSSDGEIIGLSAVHRDISERKRHEEHLTFTMRELSHRTKNVLAVVQAMARQIGKQSNSFAQFQNRLAGGIQALAYCHDLLIEHGWEGAALDKLIRLQLSPFVVSESSKVVLTGPPVFLRPNATQLVGLALHELATNAAKYGALSTAAGAVHVAWTLDAGGSIRLVWREEGGPKVMPSKRKGFGHTVLERMAAALDGETSYELPPEGAAWSIQILERHIWSTSERAQAEGNV